MRVFVVKPYGFCSGVKRALRLLMEERKKYERIYTFGEIIHNRSVVKRLKKEGIIPIKELKGKLDGVLAIRTHGISPDHLKRIQNYGIKIIDTTCPYVKRVQEIVKMLKEEGYKVVMIGDRNHPEVSSVMGILVKKGILFPASGEIPKKGLTNLKKWDKIGVVCQTTVSREIMTFALEEIGKKDFGEMRVFNTICQEVIKRQSRFQKLMERVDAGVVAGGRNSANTRRLYEIGRLSGKPTFWIEKEEDWLEIKARLKGFRVQSVGFASGTSTPDEFCSWLIKNIKREGKQ